VGGAVVVAAVLCVTALLVTRHTMTSAHSQPLSPTRSQPGSTVQPAAAKTPAVEMSGLTVRLPAGAQLTKGAPCAPETPYNGTAPVYVDVWSFDWNAPSACPAEPASPPHTATLPRGVERIDVIPYSTATRADDPATAGTVAATRTAAGQKVELVTHVPSAPSGTLLVFTASHVALAVSPASPRDRAVAQLLRDASR
jgi:hypothetical protein